MSAAGAGGEIGRWSPDELRSRRARTGDVLVVDVRTADARSLVPHEVPGARWIPLADVARRAAELPRDATIVTYCT
jgi:rhodanese-related sulfurtransferase